MKSQVNRDTLFVNSKVQNLLQEDRDEQENLTVQQRRRNKRIAENAQRYDMDPAEQQAEQRRIMMRNVQDEITEKTQLGQGGQGVPQYSEQFPRPERDVARRQRPGTHIPDFKPMKNFEFKEPPHTAELDRSRSEQRQALDQIMLEEPCAAIDLDADLQIVDLPTPRQKSKVRDMMTRGLLGMTKESSTMQLQPQPQTQNRQVSCLTELYDDRG